MILDGHGLHGDSQDIYIHGGASAAPLFVCVLQRDVL